MLNCLMAEAPCIKPTSYQPNALVALNAPPPASALKKQLYTSAAKTQMLWTPTCATAVETACQRVHRCGYFKRGINCASLVNMVVIKRCSAFLNCSTTVESARLRFLASCSEFFFLVYHSNPSCRQQQEPNVAFG